VPNTVGIRLSQEGNPPEAMPVRPATCVRRAVMAQPDPTPQPKAGYREATADPASLLVCQRCGALVSDTETDLHDRFHVSVEHPATMPSTMTRS
jgi:hypothetical protein